MSRIIAEIAKSFFFADLNISIQGLRVWRPDRDQRRLGAPMIGSLGLENIAMQGTQLENTEHVYGAAVYTGQDTKMSMNSKLGTNKFSTVEHSMNKVGDNKYNELVNL